MSHETIFDIHVIPRAKRSEVAGMRGDAWLVRLQAPPVDGAANEALIELLAKRLQVPKRAVTIVAGEKSRQKRVRVVGLDTATVQHRLSASPPA